MFLLVGMLGGIIGACFCATHAMISRFRKNALYTCIGRLTEVLLITALMTFLACSISYAWSKCTPLPLDMKGWTDQEKQLVTELNPLYCHKGTHYNEVASLFLTDSDGAIKQLFHFREVGDHASLGTFSSAALFFFAFPYICMACLTSGSAVPAGLFVPSLLGGAAVGRLVGHILHKIDHIQGTFADSGTYALMGAAAITGGITRITISLTLMLLEATGGLQYVLPLMVTIMTAFMTGNIFTKSMYDQHIHLHHLHYLEEEEGLSSVTEFHDLTIADIMTPDPISLLPVVRVGEVYDMLCAHKHHCFPVACAMPAAQNASLRGDSGTDTDSDRPGDGASAASDIPRSFTLGGTITRKVLCTLIKHKAFAPPGSDPNSSTCISPLVSWGTLECVYPDYPKIEELSVGKTDRQCWLDLRPYIDAAAYTINCKASVGRAYRMFRTLGLRHLIVVTSTNAVSGIATRVDFAALDADVAESSLLQKEKEFDGAGVGLLAAGSDHSDPLDDDVISPLVR